LLLPLNSENPPSDPTLTPLGDHMEFPPNVPPVPVGVVAAEPAPPNPGGGSTEVNDSNVLFTSSSCSRVSCSSSFKTSAWSVNEERAPFE
jgi:hypothetical protein